MNRQENQRVALTKRLLKEQLTTLLQKKSIQKITVVELCKGAGINRSTFYTHYGCVSDVLKEMENDFIDGLEQIWQKERTKSPSFTQWRVELLCEYLKKHETLSKTILRHNDVQSEFAEKLIESYFVRDIFHQLTSPRFSADASDMLFYFLTRGQYSLIRHWLLENNSMTPHEVSLLVNDIGQNGWMRSKS